MFENATERSNDGYIPWPNPAEDHPTQYYPNWQIFRYPKKYNFWSKQDSNFSIRLLIPRKVSPMESSQLDAPVLQM